MRTKALYPGIKNSQKIRIMIDGFGIYTTVANIPNICTTTHRTAIESAMLSLASSLPHIVTGKKITGLGSGITVYNGKMESVRHDVQVDLVSE